MFLFADDTSLFYASKYVKDIEETANRDLIQIQEWLLFNKLSLNVPKSNFVTFYPEQRNPPISPTIKINELIEEKHYTKYLVIILDKYLTWKVPSDLYQIQTCQNIRYNIQSQTLFFHRSSETTILLLILPSSKSCNFSLGKYLFHHN